jgi:hypothetical protein
MLQRRFPRAGYWFNMLPTHPFIHGNENMPLPPSTALRRTHDVAPPPYSLHNPVHATHPVPMQVDARPAQQPVGE